MVQDTLDYTVVVMEQEVRLDRLYTRQHFSSDCHFLRIVDGIEGHYSQQNRSQTTSTVYLVNPFIEDPSYDQDMPDFIQQNSLILKSGAEPVESAVENLGLFLRGDSAFQALFLDYENIRIQGRRQRLDTVADVVSLLEAEDAFEVAVTDHGQFGQQTRVVFAHWQVESVETRHGLNHLAVFDVEQTDLAAVALKEPRV